MASLMAESGDKKCQLSYLVEAFCLNFLDYYRRYRNYHYVITVIMATSLP